MALVPAQQSPSWRTALAKLGNWSIDACFDSVHWLGKRLQFITLEPHKAAIVRRIGQYDIYDLRVLTRHHCRVPMGYEVWTFVDTGMWDLSSQAATEHPLGNGTMLAFCSGSYHWIPKHGARLQHINLTAMLQAMVDDAIRAAFSYCWQNVNLRKLLQSGDYNPTELASLLSEVLGTNVSHALGQHNVIVTKLTIELRITQVGTPMRTVPSQTWFPATDD